MTTHDQTYPATYPAAPTTVLPVHHEDPTPTVPAGTALPIEPTAVSPAGAHAAEQPTGPAKPSPDEFIGTLTGFDELAIERGFGKEITEFAESPKALRALAFIHIKRTEGLDDTRAYNAAMALPLNDVLDLFDLTDDDADGSAALAALMGGKAPQG